MADDFNKLAVLIEANTRAYENAMKKVIARTDAAAAKSSASFRKVDGAMAGLSRNADGLSSRFARLGGALAAGLSVQKALAFADAFTAIENQLKVAGLSGEQLKTTYDALFASAQKNATPIAALAELYGKLSISQRELGVSNAQLLGFTDKVALALRLGGKSASESAGALQQLSQALGGGTVRAEEFNSVLEGAPMIMQAVAAGMGNAGISVAQLRKEVIAGNVTSKEFFTAFERGSAMLETRAAGSVLTVDQAMVNLNNALMDAVGNFDSATGASAALAQAIAGLADWLGQVDFGPAIEGVQRWAAEAESLGGLIERLTGINVGTTKEELQAQQQGIGNLGKIAELEQRITELRAQRAGYENPDLENPGLAGDISRLESQAAAMRRSLGPNSFAPPGFSFGVTPPVRSTVAAGPQSQSAPVLAGSTSGRSKAAAKPLDLSGLGAAAKQAGDLDKSLSTIQERANPLRDALSGVASSLVSDLRQGKSAAESLQASLDNLIGSLLDQVLNQFISNAFAGFGGAGGGLRFGGPRAMGGPVSKGAAYLVGERGPELFVPSVSGSVAANTNRNPVNVQVINNNGSKVSTQGQGTPGDPLRIVVDAVKSDMARGGFDGAMGRFGARAQPVRR